MRNYLLLIIIVHTCNCLKMACLVVPAFFLDFYATPKTAYTLTIFIEI